MARNLGAALKACRALGPDGVRGISLNLWKQTSHECSVEMKCPAPFENGLHLSSRNAPRHAQQATQQALAPGTVARLIRGVTQKQAAYKQSRNMKSSGSQVPMSEECTPDFSLPTRFWLVNPFTRNMEVCEPLVA
jgi:hypothetical protein